MNGIPSEIQPINFYGVGRCFVQPADPEPVVPDPPTGYVAPRRLPYRNGIRIRPVRDLLTGKRYDSIDDAHDATRIAKRTIRMHCDANAWVLDDGTVKRRFKWAEGDAASDAEERSEDEPTPEPSKPPKASPRVWQGNGRGVRYDPKPVRDAERPALVWPSAEAAAKAIGDVLGRPIEPQNVRICCNSRAKGKDATVAGRRLEYAT